MLSNFLLKLIILFFSRANNQTLNEQQTKSAENLYNPYANQQMSLNQEANYSPQQQQSSNYGDQVMRQQPTYSYPPHYQTSEQSVVYSTSAPNYNQILHDSSLGSPVHNQQLSPTPIQQHLDSTVVSQQQHPQLPQNYTGTKVIEMPLLQSSINLNEGLYQQFQQQKTFATSTNYPMSSTQKYPWPSPKLN